MSASGTPNTIDEVLALIETRPDDADLFQRLGQLYIGTDQFERAREAYERALALDPDDPWTHLYMGNWFYHLRRWREAASWFERAAELLPDAAIAHTCRGDAYKKQGRYELAGRAYKAAARVEPDNATARRKLSEWYEFRYGEPPERSRAAGVSAAPLPE